MHRSACRHRPHPAPGASQFLAFPRAILWRRKHAHHLARLLGAEAHCRCGPPARHRAPSEVPLRMKSLSAILAAEPLETLSRSPTWWAAERPQDTDSETRQRLERAMRDTIGARFVWERLTRGAACALRHGGPLGAQLVSARSDLPSARTLDEEQARAGARADGGAAARLDRDGEGAGCGAGRPARDLLWLHRCRATHRRRSRRNRSPTCRPSWRPRSTPPGARSSAHRRSLDQDTGRTAGALPAGRSRSDRSPLRADPPGVLLARRGARRDGAEPRAGRRGALRAGAARCAAARGL